MKIDKPRLLHHLRHEVYCRIGVSPIHGVGVFALRKIPKGINPLISWQSYRELTFTPTELRHVPPAVRKQMRIFCTYTATQTHVPAQGLNAMTLGMYLNHSKTPNIALRDVGHFETLRIIRPHEELLMDYDEAFGEPHDFSDNKN